MSNHLALDYQVAVQTLLVYLRRFLQLRVLVVRRGNTQGKVPAASGAHQQLVKRNRVRSWKGVSGDAEQVGLEEDGEAKRRWEKSGLAWMKKDGTQRSTYDGNSGACFRYNIFSHDFDTSLSFVATLPQSPLPSRPHSWLPSTNPPYA